MKKFFYNKKLLIVICIGTFTPPKGGLGRFADGDIFLIKAGLIY